MAEGVPAYLRIRVVNRSPLFWFNDGFENTAGMVSTFWHSLGNEAGTDNSLNYWNQVAGTWTLTTHVLTNTSAGAGDLIVGGHADWTDCTFTVRFKWVTGGQIRPLIHCDGTDANHIFAAIDGANLRLFKHVASVQTQVATTPAALVNGTFYWGEVVASGTTYTVNLYADATGVKSTLLATTSGTISDAGVQSGVVGIESATATAWVIAGNSPNVCTVTGTGPDGTQGQTWTPVVTAGEPAFAWSKVSPYAGTYTASIYNRNSAGNGSWQQTIRLFSGTNVTLSAQSKASAGTANVTAGGLTTGNAGTAYGALTATGAITANPTVSCNYSGAVGTAYFDALSITNPAWLITDNLPHLHASYTVQAMQPGNPSSSAVGSFTIDLHPPGSEGCAAAQAITDQLDYYLRVEMYESHDGASLGKLVFAGPITGIDKIDGENAHYTLTGASDLQYANLSRPFPGETLSIVYGLAGAPSTYNQARNYFGANEPGACDSFSPYTPTNYVSTNLLGLTAGTWTSTTDDGLDVVSCSSGTGAVLLSKTGAIAQDLRHTQYVEISGRLLPSSHATNAGRMGVGLSASNTECTSFAIVGYVTAKKNGLHWDLDATITAYFNGTATGTHTISSALTTVDDPEGYIPLTIGWLDMNQLGTAFLVNGKAIFNWTSTPQNDIIFNFGGNPPAGGCTAYPFVHFGAPASGTATVYAANLIHEVRYSDDQNPDTAAFKSGTIGTPAHSLQAFADSAPTFLEVWTRAATREGWYWRYTPSAFVSGKRTLGAVDFTSDPGTDLGTAKQVVFDQPGGGNLISLQFSANADQFASGTAASSVAGTDGGGVAYWRDISSITKYGVIDDQSLAVTAANFSEQRAASRQITSNRVNLSGIGSKSALVLRDPETADKWRELDKVMIHNPRLGINYQVCRVLAYTFDEGQTTQSLILDQFGADFIVPAASGFQGGHGHPVILPPLKRLQQAVFQVAVKFGNR